jgi:23S rRNA (cytosine1962-C5)-methyltransferase
LLHGEGEAVPGVAVDVYGNHLVLHLFGPEPAASRDLLLDALDELGFDGIYVKLHPKQANTLGHERRDDLAPPEPLRGEAAPDEITVREHGVPYRVRLGDGLATGLFLDQRENRLRVGELAKHRRVLNLFSYCGAFGNATASGGATQVVQVDASGPALARAREAAARFGWADRMELVQADAFAFLEAAARRGERFDVVIADPPTYSTTRSSRWRSGTDWRRLIEACLSVAARGAHIVVSSNDRRLNHKKLRRYAHEAARRAGRRTGRVKDLSPPVDFPPDPHGEPPLKALHWVVER